MCMGITFVVMIMHFELLIVFYDRFNVSLLCISRQGFKYSAQAAWFIACCFAIYTFTEYVTLNIHQNYYTDIWMSVNGIMCFDWCVQNDEWNSF